ncbi:hypothetical protein [uncultured Selenomonas sp.]|uniref:hypothetical protein n=1 Tax=uncultured Selenomonas sp. TaxID=159275 RepID=UPI0025E24C7F|nr:hypothetical protein [uncultured Selenomonas sp.]
MITKRARALAGTLLLSLCLGTASPAAAAMVDVYAGPGTEYDAMGTLDTSCIPKAVKVEGSWVEVEANGIRGYVTAAAVPALITDRVPRVVDTLSQNVTPYPQMKRILGTIQLFDDATVTRSPASPKAVIETVPAGTTVRLLCFEEQGHVNYAQIEVADENGRWRGYSPLDDLLSYDNPLRNFPGVKQTNAIVRYQGHDYYSTTDMPVKHAVGKQWKVMSEQGLTHFEIDILAGLTNMIAANGLNDDVLRASGGSQDFRLYNARTRRMQNMNFTNTRLMKGFSTVDTLLGGISSFIEGANKSVFYKVSLLTCDGERKIVIRTASPFEFYRAGQTLTLAEILYRDSSDLFSHRDDAYIKRLYPELPKDRRYEMFLHYAEDFSENPYGYYIFFDKNLKAYSNLIIHNGTEFKIYSDHKFLFDMVPDLARCVMPLNDRDTEILVDLLEKNGYHLTNVATPEEDRPADAPVRPATPPTITVPDTTRTDSTTTKPVRPQPAKTRSEREAERQQLIEQKLHELVGTYQGSYFPTQGETGLTLTVYQEDGKYWALFDFYNLPGRSNSLIGKYLMKVSYNTDLNLYVLKGWKWIQHPSNYLYAHLKGTLENGVLSGEHPWKFRVQRIQ